MTITECYEHDMTFLALNRELDGAEQRLGYKDSHYRSESYGRGPRPFREKDTRSIAEVATDLQARRDEARVFWADPERKLDGPEHQERMIAYVIDNLDEVENAYLAGVQTVKDVHARLVEHESHYTGWNRYFLVVSSAGLIHSSTRCSTCNKGRQLTRFALLPTLSGRPFADAVEILGPSLCSVCFPDAPVAVVDGPKIPVSVVEVLFAQGPEAFTEALDKHKAKQAAKAAKAARS